jgi:hypothetical protein
MAAGCDRRQRCAVVHTHNGHIPTAMSWGGQGTKGGGGQGRGDGGDRDPETLPVNGYQNLVLHAKAALDPSLPKYRHQLLTVPRASLACRTRWSPRLPKSLRYQEIMGLRSSLSLLRSRVALHSVLRHARPPRVRRSPCCLRDGGPRLLQIQSWEDRIPACRLVPTDSEQSPSHRVAPLCCARLVWYRRRRPSSSRFYTYSCTHNLRDRDLRGAFSCGQICCSIFSSRLFFSAARYQISAWEGK